MEEEKKKNMTYNEFTFAGSVASSLPSGENTPVRRNHSQLISGNTRIPFGLEDDDDDDD